MIRTVLNWLLLLWLCTAIYTTMVVIDTCIRRARYEQRKEEAEPSTTADAAADQINPQRWTEVE